MLVADLDYSDYLGELAIGRVANGNVKKNEQLICIGENGEKIYLRASKIQVYEGFNMSEVEQIEPGEIMILAGIEDCLLKGLIH